MCGKGAKHLQLGAKKKDDDRTPVDESSYDDIWESATTVEQFKEDIEALREAGWPVGR
jgi:hypothetical protein